MLSLQCSYPQADMRGKVVSAETGEPLEGAMIAVTSAAMFDDEESVAYVTTDGRGEFVAKAYRSSLRVRAWKPGFSLYGLDRTEIRTLVEGSSVLIRLESIGVNAVEEHMLLGEWEVGRSLSLEKGTAQSGLGQASDILLRAEGEDVFLEAIGLGGLLPIDSPPDGGGGFEFSFYKSNDAPLSGYVSRLPIDLDNGQNILAYVRTSDGGHFGKILVWPSPVMGVSGRVTVGVAVRYAYQDAESRYLGIRPGHNFMFPLERFGFRRDAPTRESDR